MGDLGILGVSIESLGRMGDLGVVEGDRVGRDCKVFRVCNVFAPCLLVGLRRFNRRLRRNLWSVRVGDVTSPILLPADSLDHSVKAA